MKAKPIIFSGPMVRAIIDGRKTMTRRAVRIPGAYPIHRYGGQTETGGHIFAWGHSENGFCLDGEYEIHPPYRIGDLLWVREKWRSEDFEYHDGKWSASIKYADGNIGPRVFWYDNSDVGIPADTIYSATGWRPSIHMPREAARLFLRVTDVRAERVQDITPTDCAREGIIDNPGTFAALWDSLNAKRGYGWDADPWVWVYSFEMEAPQC